MERKFLEELGLDKETIDKIMAENGKDIEKAKGDLKAKETEVETLQGQLKDANKQIDDFKDLDVDEIKKQAKEYKEKFEKAEKEGKEELEKLQFEHKLESALSGAKAKNIKAVKALINMEGLKLNGDDIVGLKEQLEAIQKDNDYLFDITDVEDDNGGNPPTFVRPSNKKKEDTKESLGERLARRAREANGITDNTENK